MSQVVLGSVGARAKVCGSQATSAALCGQYPPTPARALPLQLLTRSAILLCGSL